MGANGTNSSMNYFFFEDEIISYKIDENIQQGVSATACCIPESLYRHQPSKWRIKEIYYT